MRIKGSMVEFSSVAVFSRKTKDFGPQLVIISLPKVEVMFEALFIRFDKPSVADVKGGMAGLNESRWFILACAKLFKFCERRDR